MSSTTPDQFVSHFRFMYSGDKLPEMKSVLEEGKLDFARAIILDTNQLYLNENRSITLQASIETGHIGLALEVIGLITEQAQREKALEIAARQGQLEVAQAIFSSGSISQNALGTAVNFAATHGHNEFIAFLLTRGDISETSRGYAVDKACESENLPLLDLLLNNGPISSYTHDWNIVIACRKGNLPMLQMLVSRGLAAESFMCNAFSALIESDNRPMFDYLLASCGSLSEKTRGQVVAYAALYKKMDMVVAILSTGPILEAQRGSALRHAASDGNLDLVNILLANGPIAHEGLKDAMIQAAIFAHLPIIERLFTCGTIVSKEIREETLKTASRYGHLAIIERLLADGAEISEAARGEAVYEALIRNHMPCFNVLMASGPISQVNRASAVWHAASEGNHHALQTLLASGLISDSDRGNAIRIALMNHHAELFIPLMTSGAITSDDRDDILQLATEAGELAIVHTLFASGPVSVLARYVSMDQAIRRSRLDLLEVILGQSADLPIEFRGPLVRRAAELGRIDMVQILLTSGPISQEDRVFAINIAPHDMLELRALLSEGLFLAAAIPPRLRVSPSILQDTPCVYLEDIASHGLRSIRFLNPDGTEQPGVDAGGLTKQFIHQLIQALQTKGVLNLNDFRIPTCTEDATETRWRFIGILLSQIEIKNIGRADPIYTGQIFDKKTLSLLKGILDVSKTEKQKMILVANAHLNASSAPLVEFLNKLEPTAADIATIKQALIDVYGLLEEDDEPTLDELQELCLTPFKDSSYKALAALATGLSGSLKDNGSLHGETYAPVLLGPALPAAEVICAKLAYTGADANITQKIDWIKAKITLEHANPESTWITQFLTCVTGQPVCPSGSITIRGIDEHVCKAHTCFNILDLPISNEAPHIEGDFTDEVRFIKNLEILMSSTSHDAT